MMAQALLSALIGLVSWMPCSAAPSGTPESEWGTLLRRGSYVSCRPVMDNGKVYCDSNTYLPNRIIDWTRLPNPDPVECRVSLHTKTVGLHDVCHEEPGTPGFRSCKAWIPKSLLTIARCEMAGTTDVVPGSVELDRHERCDQECDQYTASDTCEFNKECSECLGDFHRSFPGVELEKGLCKMTPVAQVPPGRDLVNLTCTPIKGDRVTRCHSNYVLPNQIRHYETPLSNPNPVECHVSLRTKSVDFLPNKCHEVPGTLLFTRCTVTLPRGLLNIARCEMQTVPILSSAFSPANTAPLRSCNQTCEEATRSGTCEVNNDCYRCVQGYRAAFDEEPEKELCEITYSGSLRF